MRAIYLYTLLDKRTHKPSCVGIQIGSEIVIKELYRPGAGKLLADILGSIKYVQDIIIRANDRNIPIVTSDFKAQLKALDLPLLQQPYSVYDLHFPVFDSTGFADRDEMILRRILEKMTKQTPREYQKILANAAVVYEDLERTGLVFNYQHVEPIYSQHTYSGRSKTTKFNIQGLADQVYIWPASCKDSYILLHFDWICADIRAAALLSGDQKLTDTFTSSDPYTQMMHEINANASSTMTREECKRFLLKSINSMDCQSEPLTDIYPKLGRWIRGCRKTLNDGGFLETVLGRKFRPMQAKNNLAALNGAMQGSVAHAMQLVIRKIWEKLGAKLVTEIHDSLVVSCAPNPIHVDYVINTVAEIMLRPFTGVLDDDPVFPVNVSMGRKWKKWKLCRTYRESGVTRCVQKLTEEDCTTQKAGIEEATEGANIPDQGNIEDATAS